MKEVRSASREVVALFYALLLWGVMVRQLWVEWTVNPQYEYGLLLPFLVAILFYNRWDHRPAVQVTKSFSWGLPVCSLLFLPLSVIWFSNPDWRAVYWATAFCCLGGSFLLLVSMGGVRWGVYFFPCFLLFLFGVPWPTAMEQGATNSLMELVVVAAVECLSFLGVYARAEGNVIHLREGVVGVEEACSGIQSLQFAMMSAWFLGELFRKKWWKRLMLFALAIGLAIFVNIVRAISLTLIHNRFGADKVGEWHDPFGYAASAIIFVLLLWLSKNSSPVTAPPKNMFSGYAMDDSKGALWLGVVIVVLSFFAPHLWVSYRGQQANESFTPIDVQWENIPADIVKEPIPEVTQAILRYSTGERVEWEDPQNGHSWIAFFLEWRGRKVSSFASVHNPANCLPAAGLVQEEAYPARSWEIEGYVIPWQMFRFRSPLREESFFVFFAVWDDRASGSFHIAQTAKERLLDAWRGVRINHRQSLELILFGEQNEERAWEELKNWLDQTVVSRL